MKSYSLSKRAKSDLREIARFSRKTWGNAQARRYIVGLRAFCLELADTPGQGRHFLSGFAGVFRIEHGSHVIFYRKTDEGILVVRILHKRMLPELQPFDEL